jgi:hypothetical protein
MARKRRLDPTGKRGIRTGFVLTEAQLKRLRLEAKRSGLNVSQYIRGKLGLE